MWKTDSFLPIFYLAYRIWCLMVFFSKYGTLLSPGFNKNMIHEFNKTRFIVCIVYDMQTIEKEYILLSCVHMFDMFAFQCTVLWISIMHYIITNTSKYYERQNTDMSKNDQNSTLYPEISAKFLCAARVQAKLFNRFWLSLVTDRTLE